MADNLILLIDAHYLAWRAFHTTGGLSHGGIGTGVLYGFFRDIKTLRERFYTDQLVFAFDSGESLREQETPTYKQNRRTQYRSEEEEAAYRGMKRQIYKLREEVLPKDLKFKNVLMEPGYEGDDVIASVCGSYPHEIIIISGDADLFQLLNSRVSIYNPRKGKMITETSFKKEYGITPRQWISVKAISGCKTDNIEGVKGVGEKTAISYIKGELRKTSPRFALIEDHAEMIRANLRLVRLPFPGCPDFDIAHQPDIDERVWRDTMFAFGIKSLNEVKQKGFF